MHSNPSEVHNPEHVQWKWVELYWEGTTRNSAQIMKLKQSDCHRGKGQLIHESEEWE